MNTNMITMKRIIGIHAHIVVPKKAKKNTLFRVTTRIQMNATAVEQLT